MHNRISRFRDGCCPVAYPTLKDYVVRHPNGEQLIVKAMSVFHASSIFEQHFKVKPVSVREA